MRVLLLTLWGREGGISTHVARLVACSKNEFDIITYPRVPGLPLLRALSFIVVGFIRGITKKCDVIHAHYAAPQGLLGLLLKYAKRRPLVITVHGSDITVLSKKAAARPVVGFILKRADRVVAVSKFLKAEVQKLGVQEENIEVIYGGVTVPENAKPFEPMGRTVLFVGSLVPQKGVDTLVKAFNYIKTKNTRVVIVGDGPLRARLEAMATGVNEIQFLGSLKDIGGILSKSDVLALPSREEGFGLVLLEAMASGTPVVASKVGGIPEIVTDGESGLLVEKENPEALAGAIDRVLQDAGLAKALADGGKKRAGMFTWEKMCDEIDGLYENVRAST